MPLVCRKRLDERARLLEQETAALREEADTLRRDAEKQASAAQATEARVRQRQQVRAYLENSAAEILPPSILLCSYSETNTLQGGL
jgi:hypothetical protein